MSVMFKTQQGRTLRNDEMSVEDMRNALSALIEVVGYEPEWRYITPSALGQVEFHVSTRHVVEWWEA